MKTHGEVQEAIDEGNTLQTFRPRSGEIDRWVDVTPSEANCIAPTALRIKPEPPKRLECRAHVSSRAWLDGVPGSPMPALIKDNMADWDTIPIREVRPGDLTREEIEDRIEKARALFGMPPDALEAGLRKIFLSGS